MENYNEVPNIITPKDMDYLTDIFNWNYNAYKLMYNVLDEISSDDIKENIESSITLFHNNMMDVLDILGGRDE